MAITQIITALPTPAPSRLTQTEDQFVSAMDNRLAAEPGLVTEINTWTGQANTLATAVTTSETNALAYATEADASATAAASGANATAWVSGNTYTTGQSVYSPIDFQTYRHITATSSLTTDPSADAVNWVLISAPTTAKLHSIALYF